MKFIDEVRIRIASGRGGPGAVSFRREAMTPRGGPDGGDGGKGGDLIFQVSRNLNSLVDFRPNKYYPAQDGQPGAGMNCAGPAGLDCTLKVPPGTVIRDAETREVLVDLTDQEQVTLLKGGRGGKGNAFFKTSINQAPDRSQPGEEGQNKEVILELKLIADVGIIGFPNVGKSTLISRISAAKPKIADYPFTTLTPNLGVVRVTEEVSFVVADIPGLIQGAHQGTGLGIQFLKHIERTRFFLHLVDISGVRGTEPWQDYADINHELAMYDQINQKVEGFFPLTTRPQIVVLTKSETRTPAEVAEIVEKFQKQTGVAPYPISAVTGFNLNQLIQKMVKILFPSENETN